MLHVLLIALLVPSSGHAGFKQQQLLYPRVRTAFERRAPEIKKLFEAARVAYPPQAIFLRALKREKKLELWALPRGESRYVKIKDYAVCRGSGKLGPKRREGDRQVPEGFYSISELNPSSQFHLSLRVSYPNVSDRVLGKKGAPGSDIFIHGDCVTVGCLPLTDPFIEELYAIAVDVKDRGGKLDVHLFPTALDATGMLYLKRVFAGNDAMVKFWENLQPGFSYFEREKRLPTIKVAADGKYEW